jgi:hypothetical protein
MPITLNHSNIGVQYSSDKSYIIETVKSDLYLKNDNYDNIVRNNLQTAPVTPSMYIENGTNNVYAVESYTYSGSANTADFTRVFTKSTTCDILVVGGGGAGGGNGQGGGGGAGAVIYYEGLTLNGTYNIKTGKGANATLTQNVGDNGVDSEFLKIDNTQRFLAKGGGGGGTYNNASGYLPRAGGSGGGGAGNSVGATIVSGNIINGVSVSVLNDNYVNTNFTGNRGINSLNDTGCFGNKGGNETSGGDDSIGAGGGGAGEVGTSTLENQTGNKDIAGNGGSGKKYNISGVEKYYGGGGGGGLRPYPADSSAHGATSVVGSGGNGGGGGGGGGFSVSSNGFDAENGTGGGGGGVGGYTSANFRGGAGGSGIVIIRYLLGTIPTTNLLTTEPTVNPSVLVADAYYPRTPATTSSSWTDNGYTVRVKVSDAVLNTAYVYFLFNNIITSQDHYHSLPSYTATGNTYAGATRFKTFAGIAISVDFGRSIYPKRMRIAPRPLQAGFTGDAFILGAPKAFKIFASDDASCWNDNNHSSWTQIHDQTTSLSYVNEQYTIVNFTANLPKYRYYTMVVLSTIGNYAGGYMMFSEWNVGGDEKMVFELDGGTHKKLVFDYPKQDAISEMTGMTNWVKIKHKPANKVNAYLGNTFNSTSISGTFTVGNKNDNNNEWAIEFNEPEVKYYLFVLHVSEINSNYKDLWMVFESSEMKKASTFTTNYNYQSAYPHAYKTTIKPLGFAAKNSTNYQGPGYDQFIYNRTSTIGVDPDPSIYMYYINIDGTLLSASTQLYAEENNHGGYIFQPVTGGVYVKYDVDVPFVYPANTSYTLNFPVPTLADINNHSNIVLRGTYNINVNNSNILITPKPATFINTINNYKIERMYPPVRNFSAATTTVSGQVYGNGTYVVTFSSTYGSSFDPFKCFNTSEVTAGAWALRYTNGIYNGSDFIVAGYLGDWLKIQLPVAIKLTRFDFLMRTDNTQQIRERSPKDFKIYGSNDNITWVELVNKTDAIYNASYKYEQTTPEITNTYTYYGLVVNKLLGSTADILNFNEWYIYGQELLPSPLSIRYNLLNPILDPIGAQWTYNSSNTNVYHMGSVGIGTTSPEYSLDVRGFIFTSVGGYTQTGSENWVVQSDRRIKENIVKASYEKCLDNVKKIELYNFNFKDNCVNTNDKNQLGFIAQEVQQVYPKAVEVGRMTLDNNQGINDLLTLNTTQIKYTLYGAVKNLIERVENIESRVEQIYNMTLSSNIKSSSSNISITFITPLTPLTPNITTNTSNITTNTSNVSRTSNITTNTSNITTNTSNITTNTSNI